MSPSLRKTAVQGLVAGLVGYAGVALFFVFVNLAGGLPALYTAAGLGSFFSPLEGTEGVAGAVLAFNGIHMLLSVGVGMAASWLVQEAEEHHEIWYIILLFFVSLYLFGVLAFGVFGAEVMGVLTWGMAVGGNAVWLLSVLGYLLWVHRDLVRALGEEEARAAV